MVTPGGKAAEAGKGRTNVKADRYTGKLCPYQIRATPERPRQWVLGINMTYCGGDQG